MPDSLFFNGWTPLVRLVIVGTLSYAALILLLRASGKRTLSRLNAFDMVITMALGSILSKILLSPENSLSESLAAMTLLIGLQYAVSWLSARYERVRRLVAPRPALLFYQGVYLTDAMKKERIAPEEILAAIRDRGLADPAQAEAVILGANGKLSVLCRQAANPAALANPPESV
jgi:uncharacterized membrane protein YcaP (DUF421 family)